MCVPSVSSPPPAPARRQSWRSAAPRLSGRRGCARRRGSLPVVSVGEPSSHILCLTTDTPNSQNLHNSLLDCTFATWRSPTPRRRFISCSPHESILGPQCGRRNLGSSACSQPSLARAFPLWPRRVAVAIVDLLGAATNAARHVEILSRPRCGRWRVTGLKSHGFRYAARRKIRSSGVTPNSLSESVHEIGSSASGIILPRRSVTTFRHLIGHSELFLQRCRDRVRRPH